MNTSVQSGYYRIRQANKNSQIAHELNFKGNGAKCFYLKSDGFFQPFKNLEEAVEFVQANIPDRQPDKMSLDYKKPTATDEEE